MTVSALLPVHAGVAADHFADAIETLLAQTVPLDEVVLVEDGPLEADQHLVIHDLQRRHPRVLVVSLPVNAGAGVANQAGLEVATSEWIAKFDADDLYSTNRVERQLSTVGDGADVCGSAMLEFDSDTGEVVSFRAAPATHQEIARRMRLNNPVNHPSVLFRRELALAAGGYPNWRYMQDYGLMARLMRSGARFVNLEEPLVRFRGGSGVARRRRTREIRQLETVLQRELRDLGLIGTPRMLVNICWRTTFRFLPAPTVSWVSSHLLSRPLRDPRGLSH